MKSTVILTALAVTLAAASPNKGVGWGAHWKPVGKGD